VISILRLLLAYKGVVLVIAICAGSAYGGYKVASLKYGKQIATMLNDANVKRVIAQNKANELAAAQGLISDKIAENYALNQKKQQVRTVYVNREIVKYAKSPDAGKCKLDDQWVRIHDATASGVSNDAETASTIDGKARQITDITALQTITENYGQCNAIRQQLIGLQAWVKGVTNGSNSNNP
jgi:hypothetical protein